MKLFFSFFLFISFFSIAHSQESNVRGFIYDESNGEPVIFQRINLLAISDSSIVGKAVSDVNGFFSMPNTPYGTYNAVIENPDYERFSKQVVVDASFMNFKFEIKKMDKVNELDVTVISATSKKKKNEVLISTIRMDKKSIERIPSVGGESDIIGAFSVTPGVVTTGDQGGQMYVRGGTPIQNKILLDGMTIYNPFHSIGFFSVFETELVKNVDIYTGGFDAKYGGRISSIMDISYRDGNKKSTSGKISVSPFLAKAIIEGPLGKKAEDNSRSGASYVFSAKHSLLDYTSKSLYPAVNNGNGLPFNFTDVYGKLSYTGDGGSKFSAFGFHNRDSVNYNVADLNFTASGGGINFLLIPSSRATYIKGHVNGSNYTTTFNETNSEERFSSIGGFELGFDFTHIMENESQMDFGFNIGGFSTNFRTYNELKKEISIEEFTPEIGLYYSYKLVHKRWVFQPSARIQYYPSYSTFSPEPRLGAKYNASEKLRFKFSGGRYSQNFTSSSSDRDVVNLFNGLLTAPTDVQEKFVNQYQVEKSVKNGLQFAWHGIAGAEYDLGKRITLNFEGYYKLFSQLSNINPNKIDDTAKDFIIESGDSYGFDLLVKYSKDRLFFWGVYSYGHNIRWDGFTSYAPVFDRRHNLNIVTTYLFGKKKDLELNVRWNLGSGLPFTPTTGFYQNETFSNGVSTDYLNTNPSSVSVQLGEFNSERLPYYHRLDITLKKQFIFKNKTELETILSVTNAYNRKNIFYVNRVTSDKIYQFPILPSFGMSYKF
jgi:hypothetical protein